MENLQEVLSREILHRQWIQTFQQNKSECSLSDQLRTDQTTEVSL